MITAVTERRALQGDAAAHIVVGEPLRRVESPAGSVALFPPDRIVAYAVRSGTQERFFIFRTLHALEHGHVALPGVLPHVRLLLAARRPRHIRRAQQLLQLAAAHGRPPETLDDAFYLRAATTLAARVRIDDIVIGLLAQDTPQD